MTISRFRLNLYVLPLRRSWRAGSIGFSQRQGWLLELQQEDGTCGYGDCAPLPSHATESLETAGPILNNTLSQFSGKTPDQALEQLSILDPYPAARCAVETALLDLITKNNQQPIYQHLNANAGNNIQVNANIGAFDNDLMERADHDIDQGYTVLKIKAGTSDPGYELECLTELCSGLPKEVSVRLDANRSWDLPTAQDYLSRLEGLPIESLEEPLSNPDLNKLKQLQEVSTITLALDESVVDLTVESLRQLTPLKRIVLKPMTLGGIIPAYQLGQEACNLGIETVVTTTVDSAAGVWAATQLAAALDGRKQMHHGLATGDWLVQDLGICPVIENGVIELSDTPGLGFTPSD